MKLRQLTAVALFLFGPTTTMADEQKAVQRTFEVALSGVIESSEIKQIVKADTRLKYTYERDGKSSGLAIEEFEVRVSGDGVDNVDSLMSRSHLRWKQNEKLTEYTAENAPQR